MRRLAKAMLAGVAALAAGSVALAQDTPKAPIPYTKIRPKAAKPKPPKPKAPAAAPATAPAVTAAVATPPPPPKPAATQAPAAPAPPPKAAAAPPPPPIIVAGAPPSVAAAPQPGAKLAANQPLPPGELQAFVDGWVSDAMAREHIPGVTVSIVQNGQVVLKKGYGFADLSPQRLVDPDRTLFRLGSVSKTFTWILVMKDVEAGRMRLDLPVNTYLPRKVRVRDDGWSRPVTLGQLMSHSGGFEDRALGQLFESDPNRVRPLDLYLRQERPKRVASAGSAPSYSNYGAALAGAATAAVTGRAFERRVDEEITRPLGMARTTFREPRPAKRGLPLPMPEALARDAARGFAWDGAGYRPMKYEYIGQVAPAGGGSSTAGDMSRYMLMLLGNGSWNGATVFGPRAAQAFRTPLLATPPGINGWAHGFMVFDLPAGQRGYGHLGHTLAFESNLTVVPALGLGVFISTNSDSGRKLADNFPAAVIRHFYAAPQPFPRNGSVALADDAKAYEGYWLPNRRAFSGLEGFIGVLDPARVRVTGAGRLVVNKGGEPRSWVPDGPLDEGLFVDSQGDERLAWRLEHGRGVNWRFSDNSLVYTRAKFWQRPDVMGLLAGLTAAAAIVTLVGLALRNRRELRQNDVQARAAVVQNIQAGLWLAALGVFAAWGAGPASDNEALMYRWPGTLIITASTCALVATMLTLVTLVAVPAIWQGGRRVESWNGLRKAAFTLTTLIYLAFAVVLGINGALQPWSG